MSCFLKFRRYETASIVLLWRVYGEAVSDLKSSRNVTRVGVAALPEAFEPVWSGGHQMLFME